MQNNRLLLLFLLLLSLSVFSQDIYFRSGAVRPAFNINQQTLDSFSKAAPQFQKTAFAVLQFEQLPSAAEKSQLAANGITLLDYLPQNAFSVAIRGNLSAAFLQKVKGRSLFQLSPKQKMQSSFARGVIPSYAVMVPGTVDAWISFHKTLDAAAVLQQLQALNIDILSTEHIHYQIIALRIAANRLDEIAALPFVEYLQPAPPKDQPLNDNSRSGAKANLLNASVADGGHGLNGEGVVIGHGDNADLDAHIDLASRFVNRNASPFNAHGIHTAVTIAGAGNMNELYRGYASKARLVSQSFSNIIENAAAYVQEYNMVITNNSYGDIIECDYDGTYDLTSRILDQQALDLPHLIHVFAAGNSGRSTCSPYPAGYRTVLGGYQSAKNIVTVGATTDSGLVAALSSRGPVKDGRLKPEITAMGQGVVSGWPTNSYWPNNGTSMAAPAVSGGLSLLYQRYRQLNNGADPQNALMKALLCNGAMDQGLAGPDFQYGFGWMNLLRSLDMLDATHYFLGNSTNTNTTVHSIPVPVNTAQLRVLLYWNDLPASVISTKNLVNDLDLEVLDPSGQPVQPKILDTTISALGNTAFNGPDHVNNIEQVVINTPVAGTYTIRVKGTTVTNAQQPYVVVYDPIPVQLKLTAPAGGMALLPGETTKISWEAYGLTGMVTLEFSPDGGSTWQPVVANLEVSRKIYSWVVPAVASSNARVRITQDGAGASSTSQPFVIAAQPTVSLAAVQCEDYIAINWTAVDGATDYEVMLLKGEEMQPVTTTTATTYTFGGLSKDSTYYVTVRARLNGKPGRRAVAISRQPNSGNCAGSISDNDLKLDAILSPKSGRKATSTALGTTENIRIRIKNIDDLPASNFTVAYSINGSTPVTETVSTSVAAGAVYTHTFSTPVDFSVAGSYALTATVNNTNDRNPANNAATVVIKQLENQPLSLTAPFLEDFETTTPATYERDTTGLQGAERYDFSRSTTFGRLRTYVNTGLAYSGSKALNLDVNHYASAGNTNSLYGTFNLSGYNASVDDIRFDFYYTQHGQLANAANRVWIRGSDTQPWLLAYDLDTIGAQEGVYQKTGSLQLSRLLLAAGQNFSSSFQVRWGQWGQWQTTDKENAAGYTIDDLRLYQVQNDLQLVRIEAPAANSCGLAADAKITVSIRNNSSNAITGVPVRYRVNGGSFVTETIASIPANTTVPYSFATTADLSALGHYTLQSLVDFNGDTFRENDTATLAVDNFPVITTFPYLQNFESGNGNFTTGGSNSTWAYGTPTSRKINGAASGAKAWKTNLSGTYNARELSYLYSPCFDVTAMAVPTLSFSLAMDIEDCGSAICDAAWVEYSTDGANWTKLGTAGTGTRWYNKPGFQVFAVENDTRWHVATQALPGGVSRLRLRFVLATDPGVLREGIAIDDIHLYDNPMGIYDGPSLTSPVTQSISGNNWNNLTAGGKLLASVHPGNQSLGATDAQVYVHTGAVRNSSNQYYLNRNITLKPTENPSDSVQVRFYFLDKEVDSLLAATGCTTCSKPVSAYELGVSQYTDADQSRENGTLADNQQGLWRFIPSSQTAIVPFDKGYYAEYKVARFSEFWLNNGGANHLTVLPSKLLDVSAQRQNSYVLVTWKIGSETDVLRYEIEVAIGADALQASRFSKIGEIVSQGSTPALRQYSFTDTEPGKFGARYYRVKMINADGSFVYTPVRSVAFEEVVLWQVYPNPGRGDFALVYQLSAGENLRALLYDAKGSLVKEVSSVATGFLQKLNITISANNYASGSYLLRIQAGGKERIFQLYKL